MQEFNQQALEPAFQNQSKGCYTVFLARIMEDSPHTDLIRTIEELRRWKQRLDRVIASWEESGGRGGNSL